MDTNWTENLLKSSKRENEAQEKLFLELVDKAFNNCTLNVARILMQTFTNKPDYGTQERVISVFATAPDAIITQAILEELPRLLREAPEWAEVLIGTEVDKRAQLLQKTASEMPEKIKEALRSLLKNKDFQAFYPTAQEIRV